MAVKMLATASLSIMLLGLARTLQPNEYGDVESPWQGPLSCLKGADPAVSGDQAHWKKPLKAFFFFILHLASWVERVGCATGSPVFHGVGWLEKKPFDNSYCDGRCSGSLVLLFPRVTRIVVVWCELEQRKRVGGGRGGAKRTPGRFLTSPSWSLGEM